MSTFRVAVLTGQCDIQVPWTELNALSTQIVSDTASKDASADHSGPTIIDILKSRDGFQLALSEAEPADVFYKIVPDDVEEIQQAMKGWTDSENAVDWIVTTGGTGFGVRDSTPEVRVEPILIQAQLTPITQAIKPLLDREASGLVHLLLSVSLQHTPLAALSRPVAGTRKNTLIVTLPGSVKAVKENLEALFTRNIINHALDLVRGGTGKAVHATLAKSTSQTVQQASSVHGHHHHHHHHHGHQVPKPKTTVSNDPSAPSKFSSGLMSVEVV